MYLTLDVSDSDDYRKNLYTNSGEDTRTGRYARISFKNTSKDSLDISEEELMERFVRGDASRGTEGNGLGLSIAKSLAELQGGSLDIHIDGDLFKSILQFPVL